MGRGSFALVVACGALGGCPAPPVPPAPPPSAPPAASAAAHPRGDVASILAAEAVLAGATPESLAARGLDAKRAGKDVDAQRLFDQALALALRAPGARLEPGVEASAGEPAESTGLTRPPARLGFGADGASIRVADGRRVRTFDPRTGAELRRLEARPGFSGFVLPEVGSIGVELGDPHAPSRAVDLDTGAPGATLDGLDASAFAIEVSPGGRLVAASLPSDAAPAKVRVWETATGKALVTVQASKPPGFLQMDDPTVLRFSASGALLAAGDHRGMLEVWSLATGRSVLGTSAWNPFGGMPDATGLHNRGIRSLDLSPDDTKVAAAWSEGLHLYPLPGKPSTPPTATLELKDADLRSARLSADGRVALTIGLADDVTLWDLAKRTHLPAFSLTRRREDRVEAVAAQPGGGFALLTANRALWLVDGASAPARPLVPALRPARVARIGFTAEGALAVAADARSAPTLWPGGGAPSGKLAWNAESYAALKELATARFGLALVGNGVVRDASKPATSTVASCSGSPGWVAVLPEKALLATVCDDREVHLWALSGPPRRLAIVRLFDDPRGAVVTTPDGRMELLDASGTLRASAVCRAGGVVLPFDACAERALTPGLLADVLARGAAFE